MRLLIKKLGDPVKLHPSLQWLQTFWLSSGAGFLRLYTYIYLNNHFSNFLSQVNHSYNCKYLKVKPIRYFRLFCVDKYVPISNFTPPSPPCRILCFLIEHQFSYFILCRLFPREIVSFYFIALAINLFEKCLYWKSNISSRYCFRLSEWSETLTEKDILSLWQRYWEGGALQTIFLRLILYC